MEQTEPAGGLSAVLGQEVRVVDAGSLLLKKPGVLTIRLLDRSVVAERRDREPREKLLVDGALDCGIRCPAALGDHLGSGPTRALDPVHLVLPPADPHGGNPERLGMGKQLEPGVNGRMTDEVRPPLAHG